MNIKVMNWAVDTKGSTISLSIIRIGYVLLVWTRWAYDFILYKRLDTSFDLLFAIFFYLTTVAMLVGWKTRLSVVGTAVSVLTIYYYYGQYLGRESWTHHHTYLLTITGVLLAFAPCAGRLSVDYFLAEEDKKDSFLKGNLWAGRLIALQISMMYFWAATNKTKIAWINGDRMEHYLVRYYVGSNVDLIPLFGFLCIVLSIGVLLLEYALAIGLFFQQFRKYLVPAGIFLHLSFYAFLPVSTFSLTVILLYLVFYDPDDVERLLQRLFKD